LIYYRFHVVSAFPDRKLPVRSRAFANNFLDVCDLGLAAEPFRLGSDEFEHFMKQIALLLLAGNDFLDVRSELARLRIDDLKLLLDTKSEDVIFISPR